MERTNVYDMEKVHSALLYIMDEIDRICIKHGLHYSLVGGSMIGAVRHQGFIPWDDDIDISMPRRDYELFLRLCKTELQDQFGYTTIFNCDDYGYGSCKVVLKGSIVSIDGYTKLQNHQELWVDIFPFDKIPDSRIKRFFHKNKNYLMIKLLEERYDGLKVDEKNKIKILVFKILGIINRLINADRLKKALVINQKKYNKTNAKYVCNLNGRYGYDIEAKPKAWFNEYIRVPFEGRRYYILKRYDSYLKSIYGDYMSLPPVEKRVSHGMVVLKLGERFDEIAL